MYLTPTIPGSAATLAICFVPGRNPPTPAMKEKYIANLFSI